MHVLGISGGKSLPFARVSERLDWFPVRLEKGEVIEGCTIRHTHKIIANLNSILAEAVMDPGTSSVLAGRPAIS